MADISQEIAAFEEASRGEEVRDAMVSLANKLNTVGPATTDWSTITNTPNTLTGYGVDNVPASMVDGVLGVENIPPAALERLVPVADDTARFALTSSDVQNGDTVKVLSTLKLYLVVDDTSLSTEAGYEEYKAGTADSVDWSGVLNTPDTLAGYGIEDAYTKDEVDDITTSEEVESAEGNPITIETDAAQYAKNTHLTLEPVQDLHGYDHPWPGGGGKNLLPMTVAGINAANTSGTWSGNAYTINGVTFSVLVDSDSNVTGVKTSGTANNIIIFGLGSFNAISGTSYTINGSPSGKSDSTYRLWGEGAAFPAGGRISDDKNERQTATAVATESTPIILQVFSGVNVDNLTFYPMLRLASESDSTFAPYSNICPITGVDEVEVRASGKNLLPCVTPTYDYGGLTIIKNVDGSYHVSGSPTLSGSIYFWNDESNPLILSESAILTTGWNPSGEATIALGTAQQTSIVVFSYGDSANVPSGVYTQFRVYVNSAKTYDFTIYPMIRLAIDEDSTFEPYIEYTASLDLPEPVYSGTLDLETGELKVESASLTVDANTSWYEGTANNDYRWRYFLPYLSSQYEEDISKKISSILPYNINVYDSTSGIGYIFNGQSLFIRCGNEYDTAVKLNAFLNGQTFVYPLVTPITYQLTPQQLSLLKGTNNISTNAKTVQVTYRNGEFATTGDIVESTEVAKRSILGEAASDTDAKLAPILGNFATAETSPASASHAVGEYLLYNNRLYKVLAAISAGQQLTIGTNVGQTNVAAELASQANMISALNSNKLGQIPRCKDITSYFTDGTLWNRISGTGYPHAYYDIQPGDYIDMGRTITCPNIQQDTYGTVGSRYVTVVSLGGLRGNGDSSAVTYNHLVMVPGQGLGGSQHFGRHRMNPTNTAEGGYVGSQMFTDILGAVVSAGSVATGATINQQLYYVFGSHLKTTRELLSNAVGTSLYNRFGSATGASSGWAWTSVQACLMSEVEVYGSIVWSSSASDTGSACKQFELFAQSKAAINNRSAYYWLKDVASSSSFAGVGNNGNANYGGASSAGYFVRPRFIIA